METGTRETLNSVIDLIECVNIPHRVRCSRSTFWMLRNGANAKIPKGALRALSELAAKVGMSDGSEPPDYPRLVRLWLAARANWLAMHPSGDGGDVGE